MIKQHIQNKICFHSSMVTIKMSCLLYQTKLFLCYCKIFKNCERHCPSFCFCFFCVQCMIRNTNGVENMLIWMCSKCRLALTRLLEQLEGSIQSLNYQSCQSKRVTAASIHGCKHSSTCSLLEWLIHADGIAKIITTRLLMCDSIPSSCFTKVIGGIRRGQCHFLLPEVQAKG